MINIYWKRKSVGLIDDAVEQLLAGTPAFLRMWQQYKKDGVEVLVGPEKEFRGNVLADRLIKSELLESFLAKLESMGYTLKRS